MFRELMLLASCAGVAYAWLSAVCWPVVSGFRRAVGERRRDAIGALALALAALVLWTFVGTGGGLLLMLLEPQFGLALLESGVIVPGLIAGVFVWLLQLLATDRIPRIGADFEVATALALVALFRDDPFTLARVERRYREHVVTPFASPSAIAHPRESLIPNR